MVTTITVPVVSPNHHMIQLIGATGDCVTGGYKCPFSASPATSRHPRCTPRSMAKRKAAKRTLVNPKRGGKRFVRRTTSGLFNESDQVSQVSRSLPSDRRKKAKTKPKQPKSEDTEDRSAEPRLDR